MVNQPSVVVCPPTLFTEATLEKTHYSSHARCRITEALFQLPIELRSGSVRAACIVVRKRHRAQLVAYGHRNALLDTGAPNPLEEIGQFVCGRTVSV